MRMIVEHTRAIVSALGVSFLFMMMLAGCKGVETIHCYKDSSLYYKSGKMEWLLFSAQSKDTIRFNGSYTLTDRLTYICDDSNAVQRSIDIETAKQVYKRLKPYLKENHREIYSNLNEYLFQFAGYKDSAHTYIVYVNAFIRNEARYKRNPEYWKSGLYKSFDAGERHFSVKYSIQGDRFFEFKTH